MSESSVVSSLLSQFSLLEGRLSKEKKNLLGILALCVLEYKQ
jgi:hypothetical protein